MVLPLLLLPDELHSLFVVLLVRFCVSMLRCLACVPVLGAWSVDSSSGE